MTATHDNESIRTRAHVTNSLTRVPLKWRQVLQTANLQTILRHCQTA